MQRLWALFVLMGFTASCSSCDRPTKELSVRDGSSAPPGTSSSSVPSFEASTIEATGRVVAIGDLHGDYGATLEVLHLAGVIDERGAWSAGTTTVVQTGDQLDRGDGEPEILELLEKLEKEAEAAGGRLVVLNGNHETMNVLLDFRYVTEDGFDDYDAYRDQADRPAVKSVLDRLGDEHRGRGAAFFPGGPVAKQLAERKIIALVGDSVFAHGGVLPKHVEMGIDAINADASKWMRGAGPPPPVLTSEDAPVWTRAYAESDGSADCAAAEAMLSRLGQSRIVVGHTVQAGGITSACDGKVWRIDTGMSSHYGGRPQALEIDGDSVRVLSD